MLLFPTVVLVLLTEGFTSHTTMVTFIMAHAVSKKISIYHIDVKEKNVK
jgi:hypothetical protein